MAPRGINPVEPEDNKYEEERRKVRRHAKFEFYSQVVSWVTGLDYHFHNYEKELVAPDDFPGATAPFITRYMCRCGLQGPPRGWLTNMDVNSLYPDSVTVTMLKSRHYDEKAFAKEYVGVFDFNDSKNI